MNHPNQLRLRRLGIDTYHDRVIFVRSDCPICRSEGFAARSRVEISAHRKSVIATLYVVYDSLLETGEASLSEFTWDELGVSEGDILEVNHLPLIESESDLRAKIYGRKLDYSAMQRIIHDVASGQYSDLHLAAFITACAGDRLDGEETLGLTRAMINSGERIHWGYQQIMDKHCVGGLPGNRTTLILVPIIAALDLIIPKTSSRAITSPAGTADTMEVLAPVNLNLTQMRYVIEREGGCIVWGGTVRLSPADDILIQVERSLDLDSEGQLVASILSKKATTGATHIVIDIPIGSTAKIRSQLAARQLTERLSFVAQALGMHLKVVFSDGAQPVGRGIGPALEARDVLAVLQNHAHAPSDLRERALTLAGHILELANVVPLHEGFHYARAVLDDGRAWKKFQAICVAQGGLREPPIASFHEPILSHHSGIVTSIDNRHLAKAAKLAGAPRSPAAGVDLHVRIGERVLAGQPLFTLHSEAKGELHYVRHYLHTQSDLLTIQPE